MNRLFTQLTGDRRRWAVCLLLVGASLACGVLVGARIYRTGTPHYLFLIWNLFLAWMPFGAALLAYEFHRRGERGWRLFGVGLFWLLFFPNAPYIVSDFVHLQNHGVTPQQFVFWYDLTMLSCFSWTGLLLGFVSLYLMQTIVREKAGTFISWGFAGTVIALGGFGVYLGRFQRWNSWDILHRPFDLVSDVGRQVLHPFAHAETWGITILFASMMALLYILLYGFIEFTRDGKIESPDGWGPKRSLITSLDQ